jgi:hypothetical protein
MIVIPAVLTDRAGIQKHSFPIYLPANAFSPEDESVHRRKWQACPPRSPKCAANPCLRQTGERCLADFLAEIPLA